MIPFPASLQAAFEAPGTFAFQVEAEHPAFADHFPGRPLLPGVVQVDWALRLGRRVYGEMGTFEALEHLKFQAPILPGEPISLRLDWAPAKGELAFEYWGNQGRKSSGFARFAPAQPA